MNVYLGQMLTRGNANDFILVLLTIDVLPLCVYISLLHLSLINLSLVFPILAHRWESNATSFGFEFVPGHG